MFLVRAKLNLFQNTMNRINSLSLFIYFFFLSFQFKFSIHPCMLLNSFFKISVFISCCSWSEVCDTCIPSPPICSLRQHPFLLALCRWGRFLRAKRPQRRRARRNGCFRRLIHLHISLFPVICFELSVPRTFPSSGHRESTVLRDRKRGETDGGQRRSRGGSLSPSQ